MRSKTYWGYDVTLLEAWWSSLILSLETLAHGPVYGAKQVGYGFILCVSHFYWLYDEEVYLDHPFVEPTSIGRIPTGAATYHPLRADKSRERE
jgi:hypothetical protein